MLQPTRLFRRLLISMGIASLSTVSLAAINRTSADFELVLMVFDQTNAKMSYTLDLGISAMDFWVRAQQDTGTYLFRTLDPATDAAFKTFTDAATAGTTRWLVAGIGTSNVEGSRTFFTTLTNNNAVATQTKSFDDMKSLTSDQFVTTVPIYDAFIEKLNTAGPAQIKTSNHNDPAVANGSSLASKNNGDTGTYAARTTGFWDSANGSGDGTCVLNGFVCAGNPVGVSSWFYRLTPVLTTPDKPEDGVEGDPLIVDEFDNLSADGYWGFAKDPATGKYILSFTLTGSNPRALVSTDAGRSRLSFTDYSAQSGGARLIGFAGDDVANVIDATGFANAAGATVAVVPEPQTWGLLSLGLLGLRVATQRRARQADASSLSAQA